MLRIFANYLSADQGDFREKLPGIPGFSGLLPDR
jgi:hypothetical protein